MDDDEHFLDDVVGLRQRHAEPLHRSPHEGKKGVVNRLERRHVGGSRTRRISAGQSGDTEHLHGVGGGGRIRHGKCTSAPKEARPDTAAALCSRTSAWFGSSRTKARLTSGTSTPIDARTASGPNIAQVPSTSPPTMPQSLVVRYDGASPNPSLEAWTIPAPAQGKSSTLEPRRARTHTRKAPSTRRICLPPTGPGASWGNQYVPESSPRRGPHEAPCVMPAPPAHLGGQPRSSLPLVATN